MRAGFLSGANQIAAEIASLEEHLADAPDQERDSVGAAITQIVNVQARLTGRMETLPAAAWDRFKAMVSIVKAQQAVLDQLGDLVQKHVLPRQLENLSVSPLPGQPRPEPAAADYSDYDEPEPQPEPEPQGERFLRAHTALQALDAGRPRNTRTARSARDDFGVEEDEPRSLFARARERTAGYKGLTAMIIAAVALSMMHRDVKPQDLAAKVVAMVSGAIDAARSTGPKEAPPATTAASQPPAEPVQPRPEERPAVAAAPAAPEPAAPARTASAAPLDVAPAAGRAGPTAPAQPDEARVPTAPVAAPERAAPPAAAGEEQFVPVVFTHKDYDTVLQALSDLKQRFPNLLIGRRGEVQPVDLGRKGVWHRLVLLPAGTRPEATRLCDQMMAKGYDRCWVKVY
jgi:hypothetical protein